MDIFSYFANFSLSNTGGFNGCMDFRLVNNPMIPGNTAVTATGIGPLKKLVLEIYTKIIRFIPTKLKNYQFGGKTNEKLRNRKKHG